MSKPKQDKTDFYFFTFALIACFLSAGFFVLVKHSAYSKEINKFVTYKFNSNTVNFSEKLNNPEKPDNTEVASQEYHFPPIYNEWWLQPEDQFAAIMGLEETKKQKLNLVIIWTGGQVRFKVIIYQPNGVPLFSFIDSTHTDFEGVTQYTQFLTSVGVTYTGTYYIRIFHLPNSVGKLFAYATPLDNYTKTPVYSGQFRYDKNGQVWAEKGKAGDK